MKAAGTVRRIDTADAFRLPDAQVGETVRLDLYIRSNAGPLCPDRNTSPLRLNRRGLVSLSKNPGFQEARMVMSRVGAVDKVAY